MTALVLVFGEDDNDREAVCHLARALCPGVCLAKRRSPLVLTKGRAEAEARKQASRIAAVVRAERIRSEIPLVLAHEDCDAVEPAHEALADRIEGNLSREGIPCVAVTPAFEIEAWWFLWPRAVTAVKSHWRDPGQQGREVGLIVDAKEALRHALRKPGGDRRHDYKESDSPKIAAKVGELELVDQPQARSASFARFATKMRAALRDGEK
ncbi:MAG: hypothetical protein HQL39_06345 [Alphaproteobacteria bacterium]|nr:hypothetical protein [Alphaproteobacteria bacterium]